MVLYNTAQISLFPFMLWRYIYPRTIIMIKNSEYYLLTIIPNFIFILILIFMVVILMTMKLMMVDTKEGIGCEKVISLIRVVKSKAWCYWQ